MSKKEYSQMSSDAVERFLCCIALLSFCSTVCLAQNTEAKAPAVIDVHVHAMDANSPGLAPMCPNTSKFMASDPKEKEEPFGWVKDHAPRRCIRPLRANI